MTPDEEEQVRRALADASPVGPMPPEVAARLDAALAELVAEREGSVEPDPASDPVRDELERRRRRRWPRVLVAAASIAVVGYGAGTVVSGLSGAGEDAMSTAARDQAGSGGAGSAGGQGEEAPEAAPEALPSTSDGGAEALTGRRALTHQTVVLHRDTLQDDVARLVRPETTSDRPKAERPDRDGHVLAGVVAPCELPGVAREDRVAAVRLDGRRATLVLRAPTHGTAVAQVYACGEASRLLASTEVDTSR